MQFKTYDRTIIKQLGICKVKTEHNIRQRICKFLLVAGNGQALLGMPDIDTLNIIHINCHTVDVQEIDRANNVRTNTAIHQGSRHEQHYKNMKEADRVAKCYANKDSILEFDDRDRATFIDREPNTINYFI